MIRTTGSWIIRWIPPADFCQDFRSQCAVVEYYVWYVGVECVLLLWRRKIQRTNWLGVVSAIIQLETKTVLISLSRRHYCNRTHIGSSEVRKAEKVSVSYPFWRGFRNKTAWWPHAWLPCLMIKRRWYHGIGNIHQDLNQICLWAEYGPPDKKKEIIILRKGGFANKKMNQALWGNLWLQPNGGMVFLAGQIVRIEERSCYISR